VSFDPDDFTHVKVAAEIVRDLSLDPDEMGRRAMRQTITGREARGPLTKAAQELHPLLEQYAAYQLSFLDRVVSRRPELEDYFLSACVLRNRENR
jgi:hypothetical protein